MDQVIKVELKDGRKIYGRLVCYDDKKNIVL
jgi:small nuclear ribonucleoprotein (snRNP)-like protein